MAYLYLAIAIVAEVFATTQLKASNGFTRLVPSLLLTVGYAVAFYCLSLTLREMSVAIVYAIWSGVGILLISVASWFVYKQALDRPAMIGIGLIMTGVIVVNGFSKSAAH